MNSNWIDCHGIPSPLETFFRWSTPSGFSATFQPGTGYLRRIGWDGAGILNVYLHIRALGWRTVMPVVKVEETKSTDSEFSLRWSARAADQEVDFEWTGIATVEEGRFRYEIEGKANRDYQTMRTGLCVLGPKALWAGQEGLLTAMDGVESKKSLEKDIDPEHRFSNFKRLKIAGLDVNLEGDVYEMEDQRNWTDASYKIYGLNPGQRPYTQKKGEILRQAVEVRWSSKTPPTPIETRSIEKVAAWTEMAEPSTGDSSVLTGDFSTMNHDNSWTGDKKRVVLHEIPEIHVFDEMSILENSDTLEDVVRTVRDKEPAADVDLGLMLGADPSDPRYDSLFGAVWLARSFAAASLGGAHIFSPTGAIRANGSFVPTLQKQLVGSEWRSLQRTHDWVLLEGRSSQGSTAILAGSGKVGMPKTWTKVSYLTAAGWSPQQVTDSVDLGPYGVALLS